MTQRNDIPVVRVDWDRIPFEISSNRYLRSNKNEKDQNDQDNEERLEERLLITDD